MLPNPGKESKLDSLSTSFIRAVNHYIKCFLIKPPEARQNSYVSCNSGTLDTARLEDNAAMVAWDTIKSYKETEAICSPKPKKGKIVPRAVPNYTGSLRLNAKNALIKASSNSFDRWLYIQPLRLSIPFNLYSNKWTKGQELKDLGIIKKRDKWFVKVSYELNPKQSQSQRIVALDAGVNILLTSITKDQDKLTFNDYGRVKLQIKKQTTKIRKLRKKVGNLESKKLVEMERKLTEFLKNTYSQVTRQLIKEQKPGLMVVEDLDIRKTKGKRSKELNNRVSRSGLSGVKKHVQRISEEKGILFTKVNPAYTSQECPRCHYIDRGNRVNKKFKCLNCGFEADSDHVGAYNVLGMFLRKVSSDKDPGRWQEGPGWLGVVVDASGLRIPPWNCDSDG